MRFSLRGCLASLALSLATVIGAAPTLHAQTDGLQKINHIVVIYQENWSFDSLYGKFPGANGFDQAAATTPQVDKDGTPFATLPQPLNTLFSPAVADPRFPADLPVEPFDTIKYVGANQQTGDLAVW
jgi:phospholipase C